MHENLVSPKNRLEIPTDPIVANPKPQEIQEHVEHLATVRLRRRGVVVLVLGIMIDDRLKDHSQMLASFFKSDLPGLDRIEDR